MSFAKLSSVIIQKCVKSASKEDQVSHDITSKTLIPAQLTAKAEILCKDSGVLCGLPLAKAAFHSIDKGLKCISKIKEGSPISRGDILMTISGKARSILAGERIALNFLQQLSGIASKVRQFVEQLSGTRTQILDTRKTTPGLRELERYAVRVGGGKNHRFDLASAVMIKDNHWKLISSPEEAWNKLTQLKKKVPIIWEVENIDELKEALTLGVPWIQLDNMNLRQLRKAVSLAQGRCKLEATGGITLKNARRIAETGVDYISVGAITHSAPALDISLEVL